MKSDKVLKLIMWSAIGIGAVFVAPVILFCLLMMLGDAGDEAGDIRSISVSPTGIYQAEEVDISYGATGGETTIFVEISEDGEFLEVDDHITKNSIKINETRAGYGSDYEIEWVSDDAFTATSDYHCYKVVLDGNGYVATEVW